MEFVPKRNDLVGVPSLAFCTYDNMVQPSSFFVVVAVVLVLVHVLASLDQHLAHILKHRNEIQYLYSRHSEG